MSHWGGCGSEGRGRYIVLVSEASVPSAADTAYAHGHQTGQEEQDRARHHHSCEDDVVQDRSTCEDK